MMKDKKRCFPFSLYEFSLFCEIVSVCRHANPMDSYLKTLSAVFAVKREYGL